MKKDSKKVIVNKFVKRQIKGSGKTYSETLSFQDIANHAEIQLNNNIFSKGYRDGVLIVHVDQSLLHNFICPIIKINKNTKLHAKLIKRQKNEEPYIQIRALNGSLSKTGSVNLILYHHYVLAESGAQTKNSDWELISFHAIPKGIKKMPMGHVTMMRNQLNLSGGTKAYYKSEEWAESIKFWQKYAILK